MSNDEPMKMWAVVELMGHRRLFAEVTEVQIAGAGFLRLDVPSDPPVTQFVRPETIYALTPSTEELCRKMAQGSRPEPVHRFELPEASIIHEDGVDADDAETDDEHPF